MIINKITQRIGELVQSGELCNDDLVQLIILAGSFLNLKTIPNYQKDNKMTYNGVKYNRTIKELFGVKFVIDND